MAGTIQKINVKKMSEPVVFNNHVDDCIGTGRMGLALTKEYYEQLALVQKEIGFSFIRGHGLFTDDMAIYQEYEEDGVKKVEYNFTYLDRVMDDYMSLNIKPFLELGFMPNKLASGDQTIFYWKGNVTPPRDYDEWIKLVQATLTHLCDRYGQEEVLTWPIEVWNEPNLRGFWKDADMDEYFKLFEKTFYGIKKLDERFRVGGPAVCGGSDEIWISAFMKYCDEHKIPVDFVTRHHYNTELPEKVGHYGYAQLTEAEAGFENLHTTREIIDQYPQYKGLEIKITEFNTSYIPNCPLHDTNQNAAYIAHELARLGDDNTCYSYWTFGDVFEEQGVPFTPFHGGFGLVANGLIPKPTFYSFVFFKKLKEKEGNCVYKDDNCVVMKYNNEYRVILWNDTINRCDKTIDFHLELEAEGEKWSVISKLVDEDHCNPLKIWNVMGQPANLTKEETELLRQSARPHVDGTILDTKDGKISMDITLKEHGLMYLELKSYHVTADRGYDYNRVMEF